MSSICEKGVIRSQIRGIENNDPTETLYEIIDDRKHSNSNKFFLDFNYHDKKMVFGFEKEASKDNINKHGGATQGGFTTRTKQKRAGSRRVRHQSPKRTVTDLQSR